MRHGYTIVGRGLAVAAAFVLASGVIGLAPADAAGQTRYVAASGSDTENDCSHQGDPCKTIQHAVDVAATGDTLSIGAGTYPETVNVGTDALTLVGASSGAVTVTGSNGGPGFILGSQGPGTASTITLRSLSVRHVGDAPGIVGLGADVTIEDSVVSDNAVTGVYLLNSKLTASGSRFDGNHGNPTEEEFGGFGVTTMSSTTNIKDSSVSGNEFGGIYVVGDLEVPAAAPPATASLRLSHSTVAGNGVVGVAPFMVPSVITDSTIANNSGAGVYTAQDTVEVRNSTVAGTRHNADDSGVLLHEGGLVVADLSGGGNPETTRGLSARSGLGSASHLTRQVTKKSGPKITLAAAADPEPGNFEVTGSLLAQDASLPDCVGAVDDGGYNLSGDDENSCGFAAGTHDLVKTGPKLGALADNGGPTRTQLPGTGSPAIDAIPTGSAGCAKGADDQRGIARPQPADGKCDIGAVEVAVAPIVIHPNALPHGTAGEPYRLHFTATGGGDTHYVWSLAPGTSLPDGLTLSSHGVLSGTPTGAGTSSVTVSVNDPVTKRYRLVIEAAAAPNGTGSQVANTGTPVLQQTTVGGAALLAGVLIMLGAGAVGRRPGRHRS